MEEPAAAAAEPINPENNHLPNEPIINNNRPRPNVNAGNGNNNNNGNQQQPVSFYFYKREES
jgi:hypothetical protein